MTATEQQRCDRAEVGNDFAKWYAENRKRVSLQELSEEAVDDFADELVTPLGRIPETSELARLLEVYASFHQRREDIRSQRRAIYVTSPETPLDSPPLAEMFEAEYALLRDLLATLKALLTDDEYTTLVRSERWTRICTLIQVDAGR